jgi:hypothetical protein
MLLVTTGLSLVVSAAPAAAGERVLYAYATGASSPSGCSSQASPAHGCSLGEALSQARAGATVALATAGERYVGN